MSAIAQLNRAAQKWLAPRIGTLRQHRPRKLLLPSSYFQVRPPDTPPTIALVTPSFEQGRFLERTIRSVLQQNYPALEYVVQDGGSSDESMEVIRRYADRLFAWGSEPDEGQADAINRGFAQTSGEIMGWLNSDDLLLPGSLAYIADYFARHPDVDVVYGDRILIDEDDREIGAWILPAHDDDILRLTDYVPQETLFWRRRAWDAAGSVLDLTYEFAADWDLLLRLQETSARMMHVPRFLGAFRVHQAQKSQAQRMVGDDEVERLLRRTHDGTVKSPHAATLLRPYLRRHLLLHAWRQSLRRLTSSRRAAP
jgi:glycosyltransferase involved in cell wall biosynthesis